MCRYVLAVIWWFVGNLLTAQSPPNVIILMTDDQGYGDFSIHGHPYLKTPNLDSLLQHSTTFHNFHVAPVCTPTRSQLMTGFDAMHTGCYSAHGQRNLLPRHFKIMPEYFSEHGYKTALYGKWHLGGNAVGHRPHERGFDDAVYFLRGGHWSHPNFWNSDQLDDIYYHNGIQESYEGYASDLWFQLAKDFVIQSIEQQKPYFLYLPVNAPHIPWLTPPTYRQPYENLGLEKDAIAFYAMIATIDENLGSLVRFLKEQDVWNNTIFIFLTDNGSTLWSQSYNAGMRGKKASEYEGGHRVPLSISWPDGGILPHRKIEILSHCQDLLPTLISFCGLQPPSTSLSGRDLSDLLTKEDINQFTDRILTVQWQPEKYKAAIMYDHWRMVNGNELYDLDTDPSQKVNIYGQQPGIVKMLREHYEQWWQSARFEPEPYLVGTGEEIMLTAYDWHDGPRVYNWPHLRAGEKKNGRYLIDAVKAGLYSIELRRWPREANTPIRAGVPAFPTFDPYLGGLDPGQALNIVEAGVKLGENQYQTEVKDGDLMATFRCKLATGKQHLQTWFAEDDQQKFGAYYVYIDHLKE